MNMKIGLTTVVLTISFMGAIAYRAYQASSNIKNYERWDQGEE